MSGGGGSTTTVNKNELPAWLQDAAQSNLARADYVSKLGYVPQYGVDVAGFSPMQQSAMQNTADAASAFGLSAPTNAMAGMPQQTTNNLGFTGYSSGDLYNNYQANLAEQAPAQFDAMRGMFIDPVTGELAVSWNKQGDAVVNPDANLSTPVVSSGGDYSRTADNTRDGMITNNTGLMPTWMEDLALGAANTPAWLSPIANMLGNFAINNQMDTLAEQQSVYDNPAYGTAGTAVMQDKNGNLNLVDLSQFSSPTSGGGSTIYSGTSTGGVGNQYQSDSGYSWDDYGGYTGVTGSGSSMGNDWDSFGGDLTTSTSSVSANGGNAAGGFSFGGW